VQRPIPDSSPGSIDLGDDVATGRWAFSRLELSRLGGFYGAIVLLHVVGWGLFLSYSHRFGAVYAGTGALAYGFGLRHAFDADHISAVDDTTRFLIQRGKKPLGVGFFFSLGHSTVVVLLAVGLAIAARAMQSHLQSMQDIGSVLSATVGGTFLWVVGVLNLMVFLGILNVYRQMQSGSYRREELEGLLLQRGFMNRILGSRFRNLIAESWQMFPVGFVFGLGFDTATEVALLAIVAAVASTARAAGGVTLPLLGILALPLLFTSGMALMDTTDGVFMSKAYRWAFTSPLRKVYYNLVTTGLSVLVAIGIGTIEYLQVLSSLLRVDNRFFNWLNNLDFETMGYGIVAIFLVAWIGSVAMFKLRRMDKRFDNRVQR
jgi:nickel/cobalt transporter (NiCoT) family protein